MDYKNGGIVCQKKKKTEMRAYDGNKKFNFQTI